MACLSPVHKHSLISTRRQVGSNSSAQQSAFSNSNKLFWKLENSPGRYRREKQKREEVKWKSMTMVHAM
jgi:hypothetical protein